MATMEVRGICSSEFERNFLPHLIVEIGFVFAILCNKLIRVFTKIPHVVFGWKPWFLKWSRSLVHTTQLGTATHHRLLLVRLLLLGFLCRARGRSLRLIVCFILQLLGVVILTLIRLSVAGLKKILWEVVCHVSEIKSKTGGWIE